MSIQNALIFLQERQLISKLQHITTDMIRISKTFFHGFLWLPQKKTKISQEVIRTEKINRSIKFLTFQLKSEFLKSSSLSFILLYYILDLKKKKRIRLLASLINSDTQVVQSPVKRVSIGSSSKSFKLFHNIL